MNWKPDGGGKREEVPSIDKESFKTPGAWTVGTGKESIMGSKKFERQGESKWGNHLVVYLWEGASVVRCCGTEVESV